MSTEELCNIYGYHGSSMEYPGIYMEDLWNSYGNIYAISMEHHGISLNIYGISMESRGISIEHDGISVNIYGVSLNIYSYR